MGKVTSLTSLRRHKFYCCTALPDGKTIMQCIANVKFTFLSFKKCNFNFIFEPLVTF